VVSDSQWKVFCEALGYRDLSADARLKTNNERVHARDWLIPLLRERLARHGAAELSAVFEQHGLPFAPITKPQDLFDDPHLNATGGLAPLELPDGRATKVPLLPLTLDGQRPGVRLDPPKFNEHGAALLRELGYGEDAITRLMPASPSQ
jgi:crotonobetainyl-CoA:carnitine CoA-transferase CaiB-like acyl-CoA transferase